MIVWPEASPLAATFTVMVFPGASEPLSGDTDTVPRPPFTVMVQFSVALALLVSVMVVGAVINQLSWLVVGAVSVVGVGVGEEDRVDAEGDGDEEGGAEVPEPSVPAGTVAGWLEEPVLDCDPEPDVPPELLPLPEPPDPLLVLEPPWLPDPPEPPEPPPPAPLPPRPALLWLGLLASET